MRNSRLPGDFCLGAWDPAGLENEKDLPLGSEIEAEVMLIVMDDRL
jgi:hypothetical protein